MFGNLQFTLVQIPNSHSLMLKTVNSSVSYRDEDRFCRFSSTSCAFERLSDLVNDSEDCSGEPAKVIFISW